MDKNEKEDCCFVTDKNRFRYRAAAIIIEDGCVLMAGNNRASYYYSVGGGVRLGETAEEAVVREVFEETGIHYEIERLAFIHENFFTFKEGEAQNSLKGKNCHELTFYFLMKSRGTQALNSDSYCIDGKEYMYWIPIDEYKNKKAFPEFFGEKLPELLKEIKAGEKGSIQHIITRE